MPSRRPPRATSNGTPSDALCLGEDDRPGHQRAGAARIDACLRAIFAEERSVSMVIARSSSSWPSRRPTSLRIARALPPVASATPIGGTSSTDNSRRASARAARTARRPGASWADACWTAAASRSRTSRPSQGQSRAFRPRARSIHRRRRRRRPACLRDPRRRRSRRDRRTSPSCSGDSTLGRTPTAPSSIFSSGIGICALPAGRGDDDLELLAADAARAAGILPRPLSRLRKLAAGDPPRTLDHLAEADQRTLFVHGRDPAVRADRRCQKANGIRAHIDNPDPHNSIVLRASDITCCM